jgi:hypothetical protein
MAVEKEDFGETEEQVLSSRLDLTREHLSLHKPG